MLIHPFNELKCTVRLKAVSPVIVKESRFTDEIRKEWRAAKWPNPTKKDEEKIDRVPIVLPISRSDMTSIKNAILADNPTTAAERLAFFLPGASLRGVFRSYLERVLRSVDSATDPRVCDPFDDDSNSPVASCSHALTERKKAVENASQKRRAERAGEEDEMEDVRDSIHPYTNSCPACRMFGSTLQASRVMVSDAEPVAGTVKVVERQHIRIDRRKGSVLAGSAPLRFLGLQDTEFTFTLQLSNFELSQVGLLVLLLSELRAGRVTVGSGRNKGYGRVELLPPKTKLELTYFGLAAPTDTLRGVAEHPDPERARWFQERYQVKAGTPVDLPAGVWTEEMGWRQTRVLQWNELMGAQFPATAARPLRMRRFGAA